MAWAWACALLLWGSPAAAQPADDDDGRARVLVNVRGGGLTRDDGGYLAHAQAFGFEHLDAGSGVSLEVGTELTSRVALVGSYGVFESSAVRRLSKLSLRSEAMLLSLRYRVWQTRFGRANGRVGAGPWMAQVTLSGGAGMYRLDDQLDDITQESGGFGMRGGGDVALYWRWIGFVLGYGYHYAEPRIHDRVGGSVGAGGHEVSAGLGLRF
jgi:hypothetical protein